MDAMSLATGLLPGAAALSLVPQSTVTGCFLDVGEDAWSDLGRSQSFLVSVNLMRMCSSLTVTAMGTVASRTLASHVNLSPSLNVVVVLLQVTKSASMPESA